MYGHEDTNTGVDKTRIGPDRTGPDQTTDRITDRIADRITDRITVVIDALRGRNQSDCRDYTT